MTFGTAQDLSSQVVSIPMTSFGMLMNSPHSEFQRMRPQERVYRHQLPDGRHNRSISAHVQGVASLRASLRILVRRLESRSR